MYQYKSDNEEHVIDIPYNKAHITDTIIERVDNGMAKILDVVVNFAQRMFMAKYWIDVDQ